MATSLASFKSGRTSKTAAPKTEAAKPDPAPETKQTNAQEQKPAELEQSAKETPKEESTKAASTAEKEKPVSATAMSDKTEQQTEKKSNGAAASTEKTSTEKPKRQWHMSGSEATQAAEREYETNRRKPFRFWLKGGEQAEIVFIDDEGFAFWEHEVKIGGKWGNQVTCLRGVDPKGCPLCKHFGNNHRYIVVLRSIVDLRSYKTKDGEDREWSRRVLAAKDRTNKVIERRRKTRGTLAGSKYMVTRTDDKSSRCGDDFEFLSEMDLSKFTYEDQQSKKMLPCAPFEYDKVYAPLDYNTVKDLVSEAEVDEDDTKDVDADVPF